MNSAEFVLQAERPRKVARMLEWARREGAVWEKVNCFTFPPGYEGVQATQPLSPSETILCLPHSLLLSSHHPALQPLQPLFSAHPALFAQHQHSWWEDFRLVLFLIQQQSLGLQSHYEPYLSALPLQVDSTVAWPQADLDLLQDPTLVNESNDRLSRLIVYWTQLKQALDQFPSLISPEYFTLDRFIWAQFIVSSRTFGRSVPYTTLCPLAELVNHAPCHTYYIYGPRDSLKHTTIEAHDQDDWPEDLYAPSYSQLITIVKTHKGPFSKENANYLSSSAWEKDMCKQQKDTQMHRTRSPVLQPCEDHFLRLVCGPNESYKAGDEVCLNYGNRSNRAWLLYYGFALANDPYKYELVQVNIRDYLPAEQVKTALESGGPEIWTYKVRGNEVCEELLATFRAFHWSPSHPLSSALDSTYASLEATARTAVIALLQRQLSSYATSPSEDEALLLTRISLRMRFAVLYRLQRKLALAEQIALLKAT